MLITAQIYNLNAHSVQVLYESDDEAVTAQAESNPAIVTPPETALDTSADFENLANRRRAITRQTEEQRVHETTPESPKDITLPESPLSADDRMSSPIPSLTAPELDKGKLLLAFFVNPLNRNHR